MKTLKTQKTQSPKPSLTKPSYPDDSSPQNESYVKGLPPVQVVPSVIHLHEGHLGEVTKGWGSDLAKPPHLPNTSTTTSPKKQEPAPEITNILWQDWRSKELNQELITNNKKTGTEQETEITLNRKITIKLKQPKLEDIIGNPNNKVQNKTKNSGNNITNIRSSKQDTNNKKKENKLELELCQAQVWL